MNWLQERLQLDDSALSKLVQRSHSILSYSLDNLEDKLDWLQERLQLDDTALSKLIPRAHTIPSCSTDVLEDKLDWIQNRLYLTDEQLTKMIQRYPALLTCSIDSNLEPTLNFYIDALGGEDESEAISFVTNNPSSFGRSLEKRLKPRLEEAQRVGIVTDYKLLYHIIFCTNDKWDKKVTKEMGTLKR